MMVYGMWFVYSVFPWEKNREKNKNCNHVRNLSVFYFLSVLKFLIWLILDCFVVPSRNDGREAEVP